MGTAGGECPSLASGMLLNGAIPDAGRMAGWRRGPGSNARGTITLPPSESVMALMHTSWTAGTS